MRLSIVIACLTLTGCFEGGSASDPSEPGKGCAYIRTDDGQLISLVCGKEARERGLLAKDGWAKQHRGRK